MQSLLCQQLSKFGNFYCDYQTDYAATAVSRTKCLLSVNRKNKIRHLQLHQKFALCHEEAIAN